MRWAINHRRVAIFQAQFSSGAIIVGAIARGAIIRGSVIQGAIVRGQLSGGDLSREQLSYNHFHNILRHFDVLSNFPFTTSETKRNY